MDRDIATSLGRLDRYLFRVKRALRNGDLVVALSDTAELAEIARRLWVRLEKTPKAQSSRESSRLSEMNETKSDSEP
jgi:hypothetical protein